MLVRTKSSELSVSVITSPQGESLYVELVNSKGTIVVSVDVDEHQGWHLMKWLHEFEEYSLSIGAIDCRTSKPIPCKIVFNKDTNINLFRIVWVLPNKEQRVALSFDEFLAAYKSEWENFCNT